jgi:hypothetical protein
MELGPFALISVFYLILGVRLIIELGRNFRQTFDRNFTHADRMLVDQAAFFILLPIAVALHELGHAVAIWLFGGDVLDWGFYGFAGYVAFNPDQFTDAQQILIAAAGTIVNILLAALAVGIVFLKLPPMRAAFNELLIQFTWISLLNALVVYPLLDIASGMNGDWTQMYSGQVPALSIAILIIHISVLALLFWAWRSPRIQARIAQLTDDKAGSRRVSMRDNRQARGANPAEPTLREAATRVASGWPTPVDVALQRGNATSALMLSWGNEPLRRSVLAIAHDSGETEMVGALRPPGLPVQQRSLGRHAEPLDTDRLTLTLRLAMETVEKWAEEIPRGTPDATDRMSMPAD